MRRTRCNRLALIALFCALAHATFSRAHAQATESPPPATPAPDPSSALEPPPASGPSTPAEPPPATPAPEATPPTPAPRTAVPRPPISSSSETHPCEACAARHRKGDFLLGFLIGVGLFDLSDLNDRLAANGYERLDNPMLVIGGEVRTIGPSGFVFGAHGAGIIGASGEGPGVLDTDWSGGYAMADFGYAPVRLRAFTLALTASIGGYGVTFEIADNREADFDEILDSPRRNTSLTRGGLAFGLTLRMDTRIPIGPVRFQQQGFLTLGLRVSGLFGPAISDWSLPDDDDAADGPSSGLTGGYAALVIGWGGASVTPP